ncbi:MAG TPA: tetratricopeptide repeat protein, partial [Burkholderiaceae bacterium]|nr:tetratricopeptide repeat protein [Burkholderiaceae bacterium]
MRRDAVTRRFAWLPLALLLAQLMTQLSACSALRKAPVDNEPTVKSLENRSVAIAPDQGIQADTAKAIAAYRAFLASAPRDVQRPEAMRRLGDLEMESADERLASGNDASAPAMSAAPATPAGPATISGAGDYRAAIARYQEYLKDYPDAPRNDRVLYQLARAHEQGGDLETALRVLDRLVREYPQTPHREEAQFRRGELLFAMREYPKAEQAYATVLGMQTASPFHERSLYMQGWSQFKQARLEEGLTSFFGVLDLKLTGREGDGPLDTAKVLTRADRELLEDT